jgi:nitrate/nitrite transporter NarK
MRWSVLSLVSFTMLCMYYLADLMAPLEERLQANLLWSGSDYGFFTSGYGWFNVFLLMLVFSGMILDKMGTRFTGILAILIMIAGASVKYWGIAGNMEGTVQLSIGSWEVLSPRTKSAVVAGLGFAIFGVGCEMFGISANKAIVRWFRGKEMALAIGLNTSTGRIGTALAMFTPIPLVTATGSLSMPVLISLLALCIGLLVFSLFTVFDRRLDREETETNREPPFRFSDMIDIAKNRGFWYITILCVLFYSAVFPFIKFAVKLISQKFEISDTFAGYIPALLPAAALVLTPVFGSLYDRRGKGASIMLVGSCLLVAVHLLFSIPSLNSFYAAIGLVMVLGVAFAMVPSAMWPSVAKIIPERKLGTAYAITFWVQNWGLMGVPLLIGYVRDKYCIEDTIIKVVDGQEKTVSLYNYTLPMLIFAFFGVVAILFSILLKKEDKKKGYGLELPNMTRK